jgi:hypothetical protein
MFSADCQNLPRGTPSRGEQPPSLSTAAGDFTKESDRTDCFYGEDFPACFSSSTASDPIDENLTPATDRRGLVGQTSHDGKRCFHAGNKSVSGQCRNEKHALGLIREAPAEPC